MLSPKELKEYHVFLASPGDVEDERKAVRAFFERYNLTTAKPTFGVQFTVIDYENYGTAGVGRPQELITAQTLEKYQDSLALVIGLMGKRFGTPTGAYESGTEEEFEWALQSFRENGFPEMKWFFRAYEQVSFPPDPKQMMAAVEQWQKVCAFKERLQEQVGADGESQPLFYKEFTDLPNFRDVLRYDLELWLNAEERPWAARRPVHDTSHAAPDHQPSIDYYQTVIQDFKWLDIAGIDNDRTFRIPLSEMYVRLRVMLDEDTVASDVDYDGAPINIQIALERYRHLVIVGDPGSGKSTFLRFIALMIARTIIEHNRALAMERLSLEPPLPIPIFISLWDLADFCRARSKVELPVLLAFIQERLAVMGNEIEPSQLESWLEAGACALLFDGLDEVPMEHGRMLLRQLVETCVEAYPRNRYVITSRVRAYTGDTILRGSFVRCDIQPFNVSDRAEFLRNWIALLFQTPTDEVKTPGSDSAREFANPTNAVEHNERIRHLAVNPLLLTVVAIVHWNRKRLPEQRVDLYDECIDVLLGQRKDAEQIQIARHTVALDTEQEEQRQYDRNWVRKRFSEIALQIMVGDDEEISKQRVIALLHRRFLDRGAPDKEQAMHEAERFLDQQELRSGLLVSRRANSYRFVHLTFQEYLAAWNLATQETEHVLTQVKPHLREQKWFELLVLLGGEWARRSDDILNQYIAFLLDHQGDSITDRAPVIALCANVLNDVADIAQVKPETRTSYDAALRDTLHAFDRTSGIAAQTQLEILQALAHLGNAVKPQLMNATQSSHRTVRSKALELVVPHLPEDDLFSLTHVLNDRSLETIETYLRSLFDRNPRRSVSLVVSAHTESGKLGDALARLVPDILNLLGDVEPQFWKIVSSSVQFSSNYRVRREALDLLAQHRGAENDTWELAKRLAQHDSDEDVCLEALRLLVQNRGVENDTWELAKRLAQRASSYRVRQGISNLLAQF